MEVIRSNKIFKDEVLEPYQLVRTLSNGDLIGKCYEFIEDAMSLDEITIYIEQNHIEEIIE